MEKKLYWLLESNYDLSVTTHDLTQCQMLIEGDFDSLNEDEKEDRQYTITPKYLTDLEYSELDEV